MAILHKKTIEVRKVCMRAEVTRPGEHNVGYITAAAPEALNSYGMSAFEKTKKAN